MVLMKKIKCIFPIILIIFFIIAIVPKEFQNDTFFTIAIGEEIAKGEEGDVNSLIWHNDIEFVHSGYFDQIIYNIYSKFDFAGIYICVIIISIFQALIFYYMINSICKNEFFSVMVTVIIFSLLSNMLVARGQIISSTLFLIEFYCLEKIMIEFKKRYFITLCIIPFLIANLHASVFPIYFVIYMPYVLEFLLYELKLKSTEDSKIVIHRVRIKYIIILIFIGILLGLMTPTGLEPFTDMFKATTDLSTSIISELKPINLIENVYFTAMLFIVIAIIAFSKTKIKITDFLYIVGFAILALYAKRCIYYFYLISSVCIFRILVDFFKEYKVSLEIKNKYNRIVFIALSSILLIVYSGKLIISKNNIDYVKSAYYPIDASNYILNNLDINNMKLFNHFDFGSYLEYRGVPAFIDSRSGMYTDEFNEGCTILEDWSNVYSRMCSL